MSDTMTEGVLVEWNYKVGDTVKSGDILAEVETDKATMDLDNYLDGTIIYLGVKKGESIAVNAILAILGEPGEDISAILAAEESAAKEEVKEEAAPAPVAAAPVPTPAPKPAIAAAPAPVAAAAVHKANTNGRLIASPLARKMAADRGLDIALVSGTGDGGRIIKRDIENFKGGAELLGSVSTPQAIVVLPTVVGEESYSEVAVSQMRKTIARRLSESKFDAPHFYLTMDIDMASAVVARKKINEVAPVKISFNDMVVKAAAAALRRHPAVNSSWLTDRVRTNNHIHVGIAVAVDEGLLVPVIRFADNKSLSHISSETRELAGKARNKKLQPSEWEGNTFTISNLGMFGIEEFTAIINPPDACIMAVGAIRDEAVVVDGEIKAGKRMKVTLSCDHRVVDGAVGSAFLNTFKEFLEEPVRLLV
ncbi:MAG: pyruvate dehydrogenase E2 component (dihydrolipoamide acetyltransferase) [Limisphaerales bacterium]|jgi:pyruvate dehydrogenase E2 component (dihydrolipoamide acetyltransferase)